MSTPVMVTIGMPVFNDVDFIELAIRSILEQSYENFKLIISDDGSTDGSADICKNFVKSDPRVTYFRQPKNLGISKNMMYLLDEADSPYFIWAGDDDLWGSTFLQTCVELLEQNPDAIVSFSKFALIDEKGKSLREISTSFYNQATPYKRLKAFIPNAVDTFGYGLFRTDEIRGVKFPTWWWPNRNTPYNNIYPSLCFYLSKGNFVEHSDETLYFKRVKTEANTNHELTGQGNGLHETFAYFIRRFNLITFSSREIRKANGFALMLRIYPSLFHHWFVKSNWIQFKLILKSLRNRLKRKTRSSQTEN